MSNLELHGKITIELKKKDGRIIKEQLNLLTDFGKMYAMSQGLGRLMLHSNRLTSATIIDQSDKKYVGPYFYGSGTLLKNESGLCNVLLNVDNSTLTEQTSLFIPSEEELQGFAFNDAYGDTLKEGMVTKIPDNLVNNLQIHRSYAYQEDLACVFNCVAMTLRPFNTGKAVVPIKKSIQPYVYNVGTPATKFTPGPFMNIAANEIALNTNGNTAVVNLDTGIIDTSRQPVLIADLHSSSSDYGYGIFTYGEYVYVTEVTAQAYASIYNKTTGELIEKHYYGGASNTNNKVNLIYYNGKFYCMVGSTIKEIQADSQGILRTLVTTTDDVSALSSNTFMYGTVVGHEGNYYNVVRVDGKPVLYNEFMFNCGSLAATNIKYGDTYFSINNRLLSWARSDIQQYYGWTDCNDVMLAQYGNLLSYHMFAKPIQKNVGDSLTVTYTYYIQ